MNHSSIIILASGDISKKLYYIKSSTACPALIPLNTKPIAAYIFDFYLQANETDIYLVVQDNFRTAIQNELKYYEQKVKFIFLPETQNVNETLFHAFDLINPTGNVVVNLVTSIPVINPKPNTALLARDMKHRVNCAYINTNNQKFYNAYSEKKTGKPYTGIFSVNADILKTCVEKVIKKRDQVELIRELYNITELAFEETEWIDCGHETNYYEAKQKLIASRSFNQIELLQSGLVQKISYDTVKIEQEYRYVNMLPEDLRIFYPRYFNFHKREPYAAGFSMEYYGYPNVAELMLYWDLSKENWTKFFHQVKSVFHSFRRFPYSIGKNAFIDFYITKLKDRIAQLESQNNNFKRLINSQHIINGLECKSFTETFGEYEAFIEEQYDERRFCVMHGDLCFNNMLYDHTSGILKLIDARGSMGKSCVGVYGDPLYDMAKFAHSAIGQYDYLVNNLFVLKSKGNNHDLEFFDRKIQPFIDKACSNFIADMGYEKRTVMLVMASLFLSMPPLHKDSEAKQKAMFLHGLRIMNEYL